jgi:hypothetical protein
MVVVEQVDDELRRDSEGRMQTLLGNGEKEEEVAEGDMGDFDSADMPTRSY